MSFHTRFNYSASQSSRLRALPTTGLLRPLQPPPQGTVRLSVTPQVDSFASLISPLRATRSSLSICWRFFPLLWPAISASLRFGSCLASDSHPLNQPPFSVARTTRQLRVGDGIRRRRSAPASLCRVMAQAAWPSGAASQKHESRHGQPPEAPPVSCLEQ